MVRQEHDIEQYRRAGLFTRDRPPDGFAKQIARGAVGKQIMSAVRDQRQKKDPARDIRPAITRHVGRINERVE